MTKKKDSSVLRLQKRETFLHVQGTGQKWVAKGLVLQFAANDLGCLRFGLTVTKKLSKSAVVRNRVRRRLRAAALAVLPGCAKSGMDYILVGRPDTEKRPYADLCQDIVWCLKKTGNHKEEKS